MSQISSFLSNSIIYDDRITRLAYARDASMYRLVPESVVRPRNTEEVKSLLEWGRTTGTPITFRTGGTSLSGQSITTGAIAEVLHDWQTFKVLDGGDAIQMQPGVNGAFANKILAPYYRRIGPDPASINAARIGGIVSNNSSGMVCGTQYNAYHTLKDISFMLPNGNQYTTNLPAEFQRFRLGEPTLAEGLLNIRKEIMDRPELVNRIREKYRIKNTIGYSMNSFLDFEDPLDIFSHLLVGAEGTLAFISDVTLYTIPDPPEKGTGLILFDSPERAGESVTFFKDLGASAIEFLDDESLRTANHFDSPPYDPDAVQTDHTGLLVEYQHESAAEIKRLVQESRQFSNQNSAVVSMKLVTDEKDRDTIWKIRKGLYPTLGSLRKTGTSIITEDIAVDSENLAPAIRKLKDIFSLCEFHDGVIFGHAKDGNLHFITSVDLDDKRGVNNYERMMNELSNMTLKEFNGSLKAEHGTGRNMAAFVESEWGGDIYDLMWKVKSLADPLNIMNPDVLLTRDQKLHMKNLKPMPRVHDEVDTCIECGFCERICPSRGLTLTPRQRIAVMREAKSVVLSAQDQKRLEYGVDQTCATDGLCSIECPVNINTGVMVKSLRFTGAADPWFISFISRHFRFIISLVRAGLKTVGMLDSFIGHSLVRKGAAALNKISKGRVPVWPRSGFTVSKKYIFSPVVDPDYIHVSSCVNRVLAGDTSGLSSSDYLRQIADAAGIRLGTLDTLNDHCCGMAFSSRGFDTTGKDMRQDLLDELNAVSNGGKIPIVVDMSPCTQYLMESQDVSSLVIIDSVEFLNKVKPRLGLELLDESVFVHNVCSAQKMGKENDLFDLASDCVSSVETALEPFCCGTGGDRGFRHPELIKNAVDRSVKGLSSQKGVSSSRTCELGLSEALDMEFSSIEALVYRAIKK